jgi:gamma-glutamyltranspeptidase/glutathione hydrolase
MTRTTRSITKTAAVGTNGMVVSHSIEAAEAGADVLRAGGTAFDAIVAMGFTAAVREVGMNSIGGVGVLLAYSAETAEITEINFYGRTPSGLAEDVFVPWLSDNRQGAERSSFGFRAVADQRNDRGFLSVGVPSYVAGLGELHKRFGTLPWEQLLRPAIDLASGGFVADEEVTFHFASYLRHLEKFSEISRIFLTDGIPTPVGSYPGQGVPIQQPDLSRTLAKIAAEGPEAFYSGSIPEAISAYVQENGGVLSVDDFHRYLPDVGEALHGTYRDYEIVVSGGMTGGSTLLEMLNLAEQLDLAQYPRYSTQCLHLLIEIMRQAWTDRLTYLGDPEADSGPVDALVDKRYARTLIAGISTNNAPSVSRPGDPWAFLDMPAQPIAPFGDPGESDTTHVCAADRFGNVVTLTQTVGLPFGSCVIAPTTGVLLPDVTMWLNPEPGTPNSVGPWKKQLGHATPVIILKNGKLFAALGAPGGRPVVTAMFQTIINMVDFDMNVQQAIAAPRVHCLGADPTDPRGKPVHDVIVDDRIPAETVEGLEARSHRIHLCHETVTQSKFAKPLGIQFEDDGTILGGVDIFRRSVGIGI